MVTVREKGRIKLRVCCVSSSGMGGTVGGVGLGSGEQVIRTKAARNVVLPLDRITSAREIPGGGQVEVTTTTSRVYRFHPATPDLTHKLVTAISNRKPGTREPHSL